MGKDTERGGVSAVDGNVICEKKLMNIWLLFRILGLEMNFDNFRDVTCILCWHIGNFKFAFRYEMNFDNFRDVTCILCWHIGNF
jgi:hypothetical protein